MTDHSLVNEEILANLQANQNEASPFKLQAAHAAIDFDNATKAKRSLAAELDSSAKRLATCCLNG